MKILFGVGMLLLTASDAVAGKPIKIELVRDPKISNDIMPIVSVVDGVCKTTIGNFVLSQDPIQIIVCTDDDGFASVQYRVVSQNGDWTESPKLSPGDQVPIALP